MSALGQALAEFGQDDAAVDRCATFRRRAMLGVGHSAFCQQPRANTARSDTSFRHSIPDPYQRSTWLLEPLTAGISLAKLELEARIGPLPPCSIHSVDGQDGLPIFRPMQLTCVRSCPPPSLTHRSFQDSFRSRCGAHRRRGGWLDEGSAPPCIWRWWPARLRTHPECLRVTGPQWPPTRQSVQHR